MYQLAAGRLIRRPRAMQPIAEAYIVYAHLAVRGRILLPMRSMSCLSRLDSSRARTQLDQGQTCAVSNGQQQHLLRSRRNDVRRMLNAPFRAQGRIALLPYLARACPPEASMDTPKLDGTVDAGCALHDETKTISRRIGPESAPGEQTLRYF